MKPSYWRKMFANLAMFFIPTLWELLMCRSQDRIITTSIAKDSCDFSQIVMDHPSMNFQFLYIVFTMKIAIWLSSPGSLGGYSKWINYS